MSFELTDKDFKKDKWVKAVIASNNIEDLSELLKKRIEFPMSNGPYVNSFKNEKEIDIIELFIDENDLFRNKIESAIGLILYKMSGAVSWKEKETLQKLFAIIQNKKLINCERLIVNWLQKHKALLSSNDTSFRNVYRKGLLSFSRIQTKAAYNEKFWIDIWDTKDSFWWSVAFIGLRRQNDEAACKELPHFLSRKVPQASDILYALWKESSGTNNNFEKYISEALKNNFLWAGNALNVIFDKMPVEEKETLLLNLKKRMAKK